MVYGSIFFVKESRRNYISLLDICEFILFIYQTKQQTHHSTSLICCLWATSLHKNNTVYKKVHRYKTQNRSRHQRHFCADFSPNLNQFNLKTLQNAGLLNGFTQSLLVDAQVPPALQQLMTMLVNFFKGFQLQLCPYLTNRCFKCFVLFKNVSKPKDIVSKNALLGR